MLQKPIYGLIYLATNLVNGKKYVGQTANMTLRKRGHMRGKSAIGRALRKYGAANFSWRVIDVALTRERLNLLECQYIVYYDCKAPGGYNLTDGGEGLTNPSEETRKKMRRKRSEETKSRMREIAKNRPPMSVETRAKIGIAGLGRRHSLETKEKQRLWPLGRPRSEETKKKISLALIGRIIPSEIVARIRVANKGKIRSVEQRKRISEGQRTKRVYGALSGEHREKISLGLQRYHGLS